MGNFAGPQHARRKIFHSQCSISECGRRALFQCGRTQRGAPAFGDRANITRISCYCILGTARAICGTDPVLADRARCVAIRREVKPAPATKRITGPKLVAAIGPTKMAEVIDACREHHFAGDEAIAALHPQFESLGAQPERGELLVLELRHDALLENQTVGRECFERDRNAYVLIGNALIPAKPAQRFGNAWFWRTSR